MVRAAVDTAEQPGHLRVSGLHQPGDRRRRCCAGLVGAGGLAGAARHRRAGGRRDGTVGSADGAGCCRIVCDVGRFVSHGCSVIGNGCRHGTDRAETAQTGAETAQAGSETAETNAETAQAGAEAALAGAEAALASSGAALAFNDLWSGDIDITTANQWKAVGTTPVPSNATWLLWNGGKLSDDDDDGPAGLWTWINAAKWRALTADTVDTTPNDGTGMLMVDWVSHEHRRRHP